MISVLILKTFLNNETKGALTLYPLDNSETTTPEVKNLLPGTELIGLPELFQNAVKMCLFSRVLMLNGSHGNVEWAAADRTGEPGLLSFLRFVIPVPLVLSLIVLAQILLLAQRFDAFTLINHDFQFSASFFDRKALLHES